MKLASEFIYDEIINTLALEAPVFLGTAAAPKTSHITLLDISSSSNPKYLRDTFVVNFVGRYEGGRGYSTGFKDFNAIKDALLGHDNITDSYGNEWCRFIMTIGPQFSSVDAIGRSVITMTFECVVDKAQDTSHRISIQ